MKTEEIEKLAERLIGISRKGTKPKVIRILKEYHTPKDRVSALCVYMRNLAEEGDTWCLTLLSRVAQYAYSNKVKLFGKDMRELGRQRLFEIGFTDISREDLSSWGYRVIQNGLVDIVYTKQLNKELGKLGKITRDNYIEVNKIIQRIYNGVEAHGAAPKLEVRLREITNTTFEIAKEELTKEARENPQVLERLVFDSLLRAKPRKGKLCVPF